MMRLRNSEILWSLPLRECGLKVKSDETVDAWHKVTPLAGVWIESPTRGCHYDTPPVTPLAGVWIERDRTPPRQHSP